MHLRHGGHRQEVMNTSSELGRHFARCGGVPSMSVQIIDCVKDGEEEALRYLEGIWQNRLATFTINENNINIIVKISSLVCTQTVHLITTKRRAKQVLIGTSLIVQIISQLKQLSLILPDTNLTGIISSPLFKHFTILTNSKLYLEPTIQDQDG